jgi:hypothetical protein
MNEGIMTTKTTDLTTGDQMQKETKVYCVVSIEGMILHEVMQGCRRVSQWYKRAGDAKRKSKMLNGRNPWTKAVSYTLSEMRYIP